MKRRIAFLLAGVLVLPVACNQSDVGGPGAKPGGSKPNSSNKNVVTGAPKHETFRLSAPSMSTTLKQGETKEVDITVERASDFKEDVTLTFKSEAGLKVMPESTTIKASEKDTKARVNVTAEKNAPIGDSLIHVTGKPETGEPTAVDFKITVKGA
jgi:hypothetical protein